MSDPRLLREGTSRGFDRALLESARDDRAPDGSEDLALAALGLGAIAVTGAAAVAAHGMSAPPAAIGASKIASAVLLKWLGISLAVTVAVSAPVTYVVVSRADRPKPAPGAESAAVAHAPPPRTSPSPRSASPAAPPSVTIADAEEADADAGSGSADQPPALVVAAPVSALPPSAALHAVAPPRGGSAAPARSASSLSPELDVLDRARQALAAHDAIAARAALDEYQRRFPHGSLREEAELASIETLVQSGDTAGTREAANRFLASHPDSAYAGRVRAILKRASNP
ncbi:MAG: hypothetical protein JWO86_9174 [Myxococcaceae bacterium]|nr:hypothetical protein [Myxococcaceae bacterium]